MDKPLRQIEQRLLALAADACDGTAICPSEVRIVAKQVAAFAEQLECGLIDIAAEKRGQLAADHNTGPGEQ